MCYFYMMTISSAPFQVFRKLSANPDPHLPFTLYRKRTSYISYNMSFAFSFHPLRFEGFILMEEQHGGGKGFAAL